MGVGVILCGISLITFLIALLSYRGFSSREVDIKILEKRLLISSKTKLPFSWTHKKDSYYRLDDISTIENVSSSLINIFYLTLSTLTLMNAVLISVWISNNSYPSIDYLIAAGFLLIGLISLYLSIKHPYNFMRVDIHFDFESFPITAQRTGFAPRA